MKRLIGILSIALVLLMSACAVPAAEQSIAGETTEGAFAEADLVFVYEGTQYLLNSDAALLVDVLGPDYSEVKAPSCVYEGEDKVFEYENISIYTYPMNGKDRIDEIYFFGGDFGTQKGIKIGSTLKEVKTQYGEGFDMGATYDYILSGDPDDLKSPRLTFEITDGKVVGVSYYSASNVAE